MSITSSHWATLLLGITPFASTSWLSQTPVQAMTCSRFTTQAEAQTYMKQHRAYRLDRDRDGIACETLLQRKKRSPIFLKRISAPSPIYRVVSVGDGDTIRVKRDRQQTMTVRLACVDAAERHQGIYGAQATRRLQHLLPVGQKIHLKIGATDRYGRKVAEVIRDGHNINLQMVREGQAIVDRRYLSSCSQPIQQALLNAEHLAKKQRLGFWQQSHPVLPATYRRRRRTLEQ